jgi:16S rRNA (guanine1516-N2)-methyltransferase
LKISVLYRNAEERGLAETLAKELNLPLEETPSGDFALFYLEGKLFLENRRHPEFAPFCLDFLSPEMKRKKMSAATSSDLLIKAVGAQKRRPKILDCTLGLGGDSFLLEARGCEVWACERNPVLRALWRDAAGRAGLKTRLQETDAKEFLRRTSEVFDVLYLDPMYPGERKTAPKKEMVILRELLGGDEDAAELFAIAKRKAKERVVVKRPLHARPLTEEEPAIQFKGKAVRFDVYLVRPQC